MVEVFCPESLQEALSIRAETAAMPFSGGTDLMVRWRTAPGVLPEVPRPLVLLGHLKELQYITENREYVTIGAETTLTDICRSKAVPVLLRTAVCQMAAPALRNLAVIAGNIGNASPAGDAVCVLAALDALVVLSSASAQRELTIAQLITGPGMTVMQSDEIITEVKIPKVQRTHLFYRKVGTRRANALSKLSVCADALIQDGIISEVRIAAGAAAPVVIRSHDIESQMQSMASGELIQQKQRFLDAYDGLIVPISDQRSTAAYRRRSALNLISQFLDTFQQEVHSCQQCC